MKDAASGTKVSIVEYRANTLPTSSLGMTLENLDLADTIPKPFKLPKRGCKFYNVKCMQKQCRHNYDVPIGIDMKKASGLRKVPRIKSAKKLEICAIKMRKESENFSHRTKMPENTARMTMPTMELMAV